VVAQWSCSVGLATQWRQVKRVIYLELEQPSSGAVHERCHIRGFFNRGRRRAGGGLDERWIHLRDVWKAEVIGGGKKSGDGWIEV
jgi:hypothetical protein